MKSRLYPIKIIFLFMCLVLLRACGMVNNVELSSEPPGAKVYLIPIFDWENDSTIVSSDQKLLRFQVPEGNTPVVTRAFEKVYMVVFDFNGKKVHRRLDVIQGQENKVEASFK